MVFVPLLSQSQTTKQKARVIVMTDGEVDDRSSMIRFLLCTCDINLLAIIQTNSVYQKAGHSKEGWLAKEINAYEQVYPNLLKHNPNYPTPAEIRKRSFVGDEDTDHLIKLINTNPWKEQKPGSTVEYMPDKWPNTPGSDKIMQILLDKDPSPVYIEVWGGGNTASRAFYKLKTEYPNDYDRAISKVTMYNIWYQDNAGNYIETYHPKVTMIYCNSFNKTWAYRIQTNTADFIRNGVQNNHGPLGALYPQKYISEGDSPSFFYTMYNGLRNYENPTYGGWGGRFTKLEGLPNVYVDAADDGDIIKSIGRWVNEVNNDFEARINWCVAEKYSDANHSPIIEIKEGDRKAKIGQKIVLNAEGTIDPDGNNLTYKWWQYKEAGTYDGQITISNPAKAKASFTVPKVDGQKTIHIILEVRDNGTPALVSYKRIIITVMP
jgi:Protein of unknown function (DUF1593)